MDVGHGCLLLDAAVSRTDGSIVGPCSIANPALGSDATRGNESTVRCNDGISRFGVPVPNFPKVTLRELSDFNNLWDAT